MRRSLVFHSERANKAPVVAVGWWLLLGKLFFLKLPKSQLGRPRDQSVAPSLQAVVELHPIWQTNQKWWLSSFCSFSGFCFHSHGWEYKENV